MSVLAWRRFACSLLFCASCARLQADAFRPHDWERQTNDVFDVVVTGLDDLHLAYADARRPSLALKNLTDRPLALRGQARLAGFGTDDELLPVDVHLTAHASVVLPFRRLMTKGIWRFSARCETGRGAAVCEPSILAFEAQIDFPSTKDILEIRIEDDDGQGVDGWLTTGCFRIAESVLSGPSVSCAGTDPVKCL